MRFTLPEFLLLGLFLLVPFGSGCALGTLEDGEPLPPSVSSLRTGMTRGEVLDLLGPPLEFQRPELVGALLKGGLPPETVDASAAILDDVFSYRYTHGDLRIVSLILFTWIDVDVKSDDVVIFFDDAGRVSDFATRFDAEGGRR